MVCEQQQLTQQGGPTVLKKITFFFALFAFLVLEVQRVDKRRTYAAINAPCNLILQTHVL